MRGVREKPRTGTLAGAARFAGTGYRAGAIYRGALRAARRDRAADFRGVAGHAGQPAVGHDCGQGGDGAAGVSAGGIGRSRAGLRGDLLLVILLSDGLARSFRQLFVGFTQQIFDVFGQRIPKLIVGNIVNAGV